MDQLQLQDLVTYDELEMKVDCPHRQKTRPAIWKKKIWNQNVKYAVFVRMKNIV